MRYLREPLAPKDTNILQWWAANKLEYPKLWKAARDYLAGQATSASSERLFSTGRDLVTSKRKHLLPVSIQSAMLMKNWFKYV